MEPRLLVALSGEVCDNCVGRREEWILPRESVGGHSIGIVNQEPAEMTSSISQSSTKGSK